MQKFLGIDLGGTNVKCGIVTAKGEILYQVKYPTMELRTSPSFVEGFLKIVRGLLLKFPEVQYVGIGIPGTLNKERTHTVELPNIPEFNHINLKERLGTAFPNHVFSLENDANAAALGEYHFSAVAMPEDFIFITLGTGVGGAAIIDHQVFKGGDGNSMEIGHMMSEGGKRLEEIIGKSGIYNIANEGLERYLEKSMLFGQERIHTKLLIESAKAGDTLALEVFNRVGHLLGEALVSIIRILDIKNIFVGGGISASYEFVQESMNGALQRYLSPYYTQALTINKASLGNEAGLLGAASLCFQLALEDRLA
jgi:glucokinase